MFVLSPTTNLSSLWIDAPGKEDLFWTSSLLIACDNQCSSQIRKLATFVTSSYSTLQGPLSRFSNELCTLVSNPSEKWPLKNSIHVSYILTSIIQKIPLNNFSYTIPKCISS